MPMSVNSEVAVRRKFFGVAFMFLGVLTKNSKSLCHQITSSSEIVLARMLMMNR